MYTKAATYWCHQLKDSRKKNTSDYFGMTSVVREHHWRFTKTDFVECPVCTRSVTQIKICNLAKHFKKAHTYQPESVNQARGCQGCGAKDVPVQMLWDHKGCGLEKPSEVKSATDNEASQQTTKENHVELTPSNLSQLNGSKS